MSSVLIYPPGMPVVNVGERITGDVYKRQHSRETARDNLEEGGDDVKSSCPL